MDRREREFLARQLRGANRQPSLWDAVKTSATISAASFLVAYLIGLVIVWLLSL